MQFRAVSSANPDRPVLPDHVPPVGDGQGYAGLELLLISFCGCVSTAVVAMLRNAGKHIAEYKGTAIGIRQEQPLKLNKIRFAISVKSDDILPADMDRVMKIAGEISPVWIAIKNNVEVETEYTIES